MITMRAESDAVADADVVGAIRAGDRDRYRELVERYADKVFAIAWSRLGDRGLAEEAAQEAFIKGYRRLGLLGQAERFGAWIGTIARHTAINLGIRHRGELQRRQRWALEAEPEGDAGAAARGGDEDGPLPNPETLRATLEQLPASHRECLVLFYLENRSGAEAAAVLGISENAFKVRLHRARGALRTALEGRLETNLQRLRAPARLSSAVMLALPSMPWSGGWLGVGTIGSVMGKLAPFGPLLMVLQIVSMFPGLLLAWWVGRKELANFREPGAFRGHFYRVFLRRMLLFVAGIVLLTMVLSRGLSLIVIDQAERWGFALQEMDVGIRPYALLFAVLTLVTAVDQWRRLYCIRHPLNYSVSAGLSVFAVMFAASAITGNATGWFSMGQGLFFLIMSFGIPKVAPRMDYSLFTRAAHGLLRDDRDDDGDPGSGNGNEREGVAGRRASKGMQLAFARFLGRRQMIENWRWAGAGLELCLARVAPSPVRASIPFLWRGSSRVVLREDGRVDAKLDENEWKELGRSMNGSGAPSIEELESRAGRAAERAWTALAEGREAAAARCLGEASEAEIFRVLPEKSSAARIRGWVLRGAAALFLFYGAKQLWFTPPLELQRISYKQPVAITEPQVREFLAKLAPGHTNQPDAWGQFEFGLRSYEGLPARELFEPDILRSLQRSLVSEIVAAGRTWANTPLERVRGMLGRLDFMRAVAGGLFTGADLEELGLGATVLRAGLAEATDADREFWSRLIEFPVHGQGPGKRALGTRELANRIRYLASMGESEVLDLREAADMLVECQVLPGNSLAARWPVPDRQEWHGLFVTMWGETLRDTYDALTILEAAKALDRIDREACVAGLLRFHRGRGILMPHGVNPTAREGGDSTDTWAGFASLRILGALNRVQDLRKWEFRPSFPSLEMQTRGGAKILAWTHVEAWSLREAFRKETSTAHP